MTKTIHKEFLFLSPAKINLFLQVMFQRKDGYHEIITDLLAVNLYDEIKIIPQATTNKKILIRKNYSTQTIDLVQQAISLLEEKINRSFSLLIKITKQIPIGAGLGGGSSNAATILLALNRIFNLGLTTAELCALANKLGADVAFFLYQKPMRMGGIGEVPLAPLSIRALPILILKPNFSIATKNSYQNYKIQNRKINFAPHYSLAQVKKISVLQNSLYAAACKKYPLLKKYHQKLQDTLPLSVQMSGSGSSLFAIYQCASLRDHAASILQTSNSKNEFQLYPCSNLCSTKLPLL